MAVTQLGIQGHEFHFSGSPLMSTLLTGLSYLLIFTITPVLTFKVVSKINPYLSRKFPASKEEMEHLDYLLSEENPKRDIYERFALIEVGIFIIPLSVFLVILTVWPFTVLQNASGAITLFHVSVSAIILAFPALFLVVNVAATP